MCVCVYVHVYVHMHSHVYAHVHILPPSYQRHEYGRELALKVQERLDKRSCSHLHPSHYGHKPLTLQPKTANISTINT